MIDINTHIHIFWRMMNTVIHIVYIIVKGIMIVILFEILILIIVIFVIQDINFQENTSLTKNNEKFITKRIIIIQMKYNKEEIQMKIQIQQIYE